MMIQEISEQWRRTDASRKPSFALIDKNLLNYPLARDCRVRHHWVKGAKTGRNYTHLDDRITLSLPPNAEIRCPNGFDVNVLFILLAEARKQDGGKIDLPSLTAIVSKMGLGADASNLRRVRTSLTLWSTISIRFRNYYAARWRRPDTKKGVGGTNVDRKFPPPINSLKIGRGQIRVSIHEDWREYHKKYFERVPLPLPMPAAAQNVVLCTIVSMATGNQRSVRKFCRKIGLNHTTRRRVLRNALQIAEQYYERNGGALSHVIEQKRIQFWIAKPDNELAAQVPLAQSEIHSANRTKKIERVRLIKRTKRIELVERAKRTEPRPIGAVDEDGRRYTLYEQPDGRLTEDPEGLVPTE
jgi:hypothetical protein